MVVVDVIVALLVGAVQGVVEWLPISSEGTVALVLTLLEFDPTLAVQLALFLHLGTAVAATVYYRHELIVLLQQLQYWHPNRAFTSLLARLSFLGLATIVSAIVGIAGYQLLLEVASELSGGAFIAIIGALLVITGVVQRVADDSVIAEPSLPRPLDAILVGIGQGLAVLPGISRSGTTVSLLLLRGYDGETAFELSFILSIPAAVGAAVLAANDIGVVDLSLTTAGVALGASAVVGFLTIDLLLRVVRRIAFWGICIGFGGLAIAGGLLVMLF